MDQLLFLILPEVEVLDLAGPLQAFHEANRARPRYRIRFVSTRPRVKSDQGLGLDNLTMLPKAGKGDLIVVPGMPYQATQRVDRAAIGWLRACYRAGARVASVCTGAFIIGEAGLLDGRRCTTHWARIEELQRKLWVDADVDIAPVRSALDKHAAACGFSRVVMGRAALVRT